MSDGVDKQYDYHEVVFHGEVGLEPVETQTVVDSALGDAHDGEVLLGGFDMRQGFGLRYVTKDVGGCVRMAENSPMMRCPARRMQSRRSSVAMRALSQWMRLFQSIRKRTDRRAHCSERFDGH